MHFGQETDHDYTSRREAARTSQGARADPEKLADLAGLSKSYLWELENRESQRPSAEKLTALADALGVAATYFLEEDVRAPEERHLDEAFFRGYQKLEPEAKAASQNT
jgi:transcriptional regulator with XRE-family HTH domain